MLHNDTPPEKGGGYSLKEERKSKKRFFCGCSNPSNDDIMFERPGLETQEGK